MKKQTRTRLLRVLLPILGLALVLSALGLYRQYGQIPEDLAEYYARLYPRQRIAEDLCRVQYDYPHLLEAAKTVLVVTPETELPTGGKGYSLRSDYAGTDLRVKYRAWDPHTYRRVKVLRVLKGEAEPGETVGIWEYCALTEAEHLLLRYTAEDWPMVKGNVYLLFLDNVVSRDDIRDVRTVCGANGWFDLTHLRLNDIQYMDVLRNAIYDLDLRDPDAAGIATPWTDRRFCLEGRFTDQEGK